MIQRRDDPALSTPMMRQYLAIKERHPRELLFFRMGDFYEMFLEDAEEASKLLGLTLTSRSKDKNAIPMAGLPVRAIDTYLPKLLKAGKRVAICEQTQDPKETKGLVDREVVRVISPGTIVDDTLIGEDTNNYIAAITRAKTGFGLAWLDVSTGRFLLWQTEDVLALCSEISRVDPAEILLPESLAFGLEEGDALQAALRDIVQTPFADPHFDYDSAYRVLTEQLRTATLEGFGCEHMKLATRAGGGLMQYIVDTQKTALSHITKVSAYRHQRHLPIDQATRKALEVTETYRGGDRSGTLISCLDRTASSMGARLLREWVLAPLTDVDDIVRRQEVVAEFVTDDDLRSQTIDLLRHVHDLERLSARISYRSANGRDLVALKNSLTIVPKIRVLLEESPTRYVAEILSQLEVPSELVDQLEAALVDEPPLAVKEGGVIREGYSPELDETREIASEGTRWIARFQQREIKETGIPSLKVSYNKVFGYYIEVTNTHQDKVPEHYIRKQTLKNCERFLTAELKEYESKVLNAKDRAVELEYEIFCGIRDRAMEHIPTFQRIAAATAQLDVLVTFARIARERDYVRPAINDSARLRIVDGRYPIVEHFQGAEGFVPNSVELDDENRIMMITGPNMAGKSTYIRQVAVLTLMAQTGCFIPAREAELGVVDRIFTRVGAADDLAKGQSTFMVEMHETANILNNATPRSLVVLDEVGRGTSTYDGVSLAWAITELLAETISCRTLFATHYHELTALSTSFSNIKNFNFAVKEWNDEIIFLRKVVEGGTDRSYGIHVARLAGIPKPALDRAREILSNLEAQAFDLQDRPRIAHRDTTSVNAPEPTEAGLQLDFFRSPNEDILRDLKRTDLDRLTPLEALQLLSDLQKRIV